MLTLFSFPRLLFFRFRFMWDCVSWSGLILDCEVGELLVFRLGSETEVSSVSVRVEVSLTLTDFYSHLKCCRHCEAERQDLHLKRLEVMAIEPETTAPEDQVAGWSLAKAPRGW